VSPRASTTVVSEYRVCVEHDVVNHVPSFWLTLIGFTNFWQSVYIRT